MDKTSKDYVEGYIGGLSAAGVLVTEGAFMLDGDALHAAIEFANKSGEDRVTGVMYELIASMKESDMTWREVLEGFKDGDSHALKELTEEMRKYSYEVEKFNKAMGNIGLCSNCADGKGR